MWEEKTNHCGWTVLKRNLVPDNIPFTTDMKYEIAGITAGSIRT